MKRILKYTVDIRVDVIDLPEGAQIISAGAQGIQIVIWAIVKGEALKSGILKPRGLAAVATGFDLLEEGLEYKFIDTVQLDNGLVYHIFEYEEK